jgi:hypothetical protein
MSRRTVCAPTGAGAAGPPQAAPPRDGTDGDLFR